MSKNKIIRQPDKGVRLKLEDIMNFLKKASAILLTTVFSFSLFGCGAKEAELTEVKIGYFNNVTHAQALYLKANGTLEEAYGDDVNVTWTAFNAGPAEVEALFAEDIDIGYIGPVPAVTANVKSKGDVQILSSATKGGAIMIKPAGSDINSIADLDGKNVSIPQIGNTQHLCLLNLMTENNLAADTAGGSVTLSAIANADLENVMERGDVDAAIVPEPWGATLLSRGAEMLADYDEIYLGGDYDVAVVVVRKDFREKHPEAVDTFLNAHKKATADINANPTETLSVINAEIDAATGKSLTEEILADAFTRITVSDEINKDSITGFANVSKEQGFISELPGEDLYVD